MQIKSRITVNRLEKSNSADWNGRKTCVTKGMLAGAGRGREGRYKKHRQCKKRLQAPLPSDRLDSIPMPIVFVLNQTNSNKDLEGGTDHF